MSMETPKLFPTRASTIQHPNWLRRGLRCAVIIFASLVVLALYATVANLYMFPAFSWCSPLDSDDIDNNGNGLSGVAVYFYDAAGQVPPLPQNLTSSAGIWWANRPDCAYSNNPFFDVWLVFKMLGILVAPLMWWAAKMYKIRPDASVHALNCWKCCKRCNLPRKIDNLLTGAGANLLLGSATAMAYHAGPAQRYEISYPLTHLILDLCLFFLALLAVPILLCKCCCRIKWGGKALLLLFFPFFVVLICLGFLETLTEQTPQGGFGLFASTLLAQISLSTPSPGPLVGHISLSIVGPCLFAIEAIDTIFDDKIPVLGIGLCGYGKKMRVWLNAEEFWEDEPPAQNPADVKSTEDKLEHAHIHVVTSP